MTGKVKGSNRRTEQAAETRLRVIAAAGRLFQERGYGGTTPDDDQPADVVLVHISSRNRLQAR